MSRTATDSRKTAEHDGSTSSRTGIPIAALAAAAIGLGALLLALVGGDGPETAAVGPMGGEVMDVGLERSGTVTAGPVRVIGSSVEMGDVPLDVTVVPSWTLENTGQDTVVLGEPHASVLEGCCPGPLRLGIGTLAPGERTELTFPLQMHPGMDGPHHFAVHVPVGSDGEVLELHATADFHN